MLCSYKYCGLANKAQSDGVVLCPLCYQIRYCSQRCKDLDWTISHKLNCKGKQVKQTDVNDTHSTLKSIGKNIDDFEIIVKDGKSELGRGSYGQVKLVKDRQNGQLYAMKILNKKRIFEYWSTENLKREIKIQRRLTHPHIVRLYHYFEDKENVYLILELAENGSLFVYIRRRKRLPEKEAFVYFFQTCLGIEYLHKKNILHRDLKPENLLLDKQGNIKVCDFGWSAEANQQTKRTTFCGTLDYMAPEMLLNKPYDFKLDIWCLGILLYELIHGFAPFKGKTNQEKGQNIINLLTIEFNPLCSFEVKDLISNILKTNPEERLSLLQIFEHPFMKRNYNINYYFISCPLKLFNFHKLFIIYQKIDFLLCMKVMELIQINILIKKRKSKIDLYLQYRNNQRPETLHCHNTIHHMNQINLHCSIHFQFNKKILLFKITKVQINQQLEQIHPYQLILKMMNQKLESVGFRKDNKQLNNKEKQEDQLDKPIVILDLWIEYFKLQDV